MWACKREGRFQDYPAEVTAIIEAAYAARAGDADRGRVEFDVRGESYLRATPRGTPPMDNLLAKLAGETPDADGG
eukprot:COSAG04_NODE_3164_length_3099_cov_3.504000_2_plen_74_part_01